MMSMAHSTGGAGDRKGKYQNGKRLRNGFYKSRP
jgi:hypothetical protein